MSDLQVMPSPCPECPFSNKRQGFLGKSRATEIAESLSRGDSFSCHKTLSYDTFHGKAIAGVTVMCAGAALLLENVKKPNQLMQIAERLGKIMACEFYKTPTGQEQSFSSFEDFIKHHS